MLKNFNNIAGGQETQRVGLFHWELLGSWLFDPGKKALLVGKVAAWQIFLWHTHRLSEVPWVLQSPVYSTRTMHF
jgi:hypothetical protein